MPYIEPLSNERASEPAKQLFGVIENEFGMVPNIYRTMGHAPDVLDAVLHYSTAIEEQLPGNLRELAYLRASITNGCRAIDRSGFLSAGRSLEPFGAPPPSVEMRQRVWAW